MDLARSGSASERRRWYSITIGLLVSTVPWLPSDISVLGLPAWAAVSLLLTLVYAVVLARALGRAFDEHPDEPGASRGDA